MANITTINDIISEKMQKIKDNWLINLFFIAEEMEIYDYQMLENAIAIPAQNYMVASLPKFQVKLIEPGIKNIIYVLGLFVQSGNRGYKEILDIIATGKGFELIEEAKQWYIARIKHLQKIISKSKLQVPRESTSYRPTRQLLKELKDTSLIFEQFPCYKEILEARPVASIYAPCISSEVGIMTGYFAFEKAVYRTYRELKILSKFDYKMIDKHVKNYCKQVLIPIYEGNLFDLVINNYLFGTLYNDESKSLMITNVDAKLIFAEIINGSVTANELINTLINEFGYEDKKFELELLKGYEQRLQYSIDRVRKTGNLGELFIITFPAK